MEESQLIYGEKGATKMELLKNGLQNIENQYLEYFKNKPSRRSIEEHDHLHNHYSMITNSHGIKFGFDANSDLDEKIKTDCINLFDEIFKLEIDNNK